MGMPENKIDEQENGIHFDEQGFAELAERYGTPLYVFSERQLKRNVREIQEKFGRYHSRISVHYAVKFEFAVAHLQIIKIAGGSLEAKSVGELLKGLYAGFEGNQIVFNGADKSEDEIEMAILTGVKSINADSELELKRIMITAMRLKKSANVSIHIMPGGLNSETVENAVRSALENPGRISLKGYRFHGGTQVCDPKSFIDAFRKLLRLAIDTYIKTGYRPELLMIGGELPMEKIAKELCAELSEEKVREWAGKENAGFFKDVELILEPGRKAVDSAGVLLSGTESQIRPRKAAEAHVVLIRENGQAVMIAPAKKYGDLAADEAEHLNKPKSRFKSEQEGVCNV
jgi:diaminopimelate decarboxylase